MRPSTVEEVLASLHYVGEQTHGVGQNTLDNFFLTAGMEVEHTGPQMVSQLTEVSCLTSVVRAHQVHTTFVSHSICLSSSLTNSQTQRRGLSHIRN